MGCVCVMFTFSQASDAQRGLLQAELCWEHSDIGRDRKDPKFTIWPHYRSIGCPLLSPHTCTISFMASMSALYNVCGPIKGCLVHHFFFLLTHCTPVPCLGAGHSGRRQSLLLCLDKGSWFCSKLSSPVSPTETPTAFFTLYLPAVHILLKTQLLPQAAGPLCITTTDRPEVLSFRAPRSPCSYTLAPFSSMTDTCLSLQTVNSIRAVTRQGLTWCLITDTYSGNFTSSSLKPTLHCMQLVYDR